MLLKDYYKTLEISPAATEQEIKRSFRRLVHRLHPDKNAGDAVAAARFREIREAYDVLSDPHQREEYNYKRWYNRSLGKVYQAAPLTPQGILRECQRLQRYVRSVTPSRVDYDALSYHIRTQLLNESNLHLLKQFNDTAVNRQIIQILSGVCRPLPWPYIPPITSLLEQVAGGDATASGQVAAFLAMHRDSGRWNRYRVALVLLATALLCALIYLVSR